MVVPDRHDRGEDPNLATDDQVRSRSGTNSSGSRTTRRHPAHWFRSEACVRRAINSGSFARAKGVSPEIADLIANQAIGAKAVKDLGSVVRGGRMDPAQAEILKNKGLLHPSDPGDPESPLHVTSDAKPLALLLAVSLLPAPCFLLAPPSFLSCTWERPCSRSSTSSVFRRWRDFPQEAQLRRGRRPRLALPAQILQ